MLLANGCSFTEGYDLTDQTQRWSDVLGQQLGYSQIINQAIGGASNDRIFRTTKEYLVSNSPELIVIGWTQFDRNELSHCEGFYVRCHGSVCLPECEYTPNDVDTVHKNWLLYNHNKWINYRNWIYDVVFLQNYFAKTNQCYRFFTAFDYNYIEDFLNGTDTALELADLSYQWRDRTRYQPERTIHQEYQELVNIAKQINLDNWVHPFSSMGEFLNNANYQTDHTGHYLEDGHQRWAQEIHDTLR